MAVTAFGSSGYQMSLSNSRSCRVFVNPIVVSPFLPIDRRNINCIKLNAMYLTRSLPVDRRPRKSQASDRPWASAGDPGQLFLFHRFVPLCSPYWKLNRCSNRFSIARWQAAKWGRRKREPPTDIWWSRLHADLVGGEDAPRATVIVGHCSILMDLCN